MNPLFLSREQVLGYHRQQIELFGGAAGVLDEGLLESALAQPENTYLYDSQADRSAAAYAFHLVKNHPFRDNKRAALQAALGFLKFNGVTIKTSQDEMYESTIRLTTSEWTKREFAAFLRENSQAEGNP